jgi:hypothetical protein
MRQEMLPVCCGKSEVMECLLSREGKKINVLAAEDGVGKSYAAVVRASVTAQEYLLIGAPGH